MDWNGIYLLSNNPQVRDLWPAYPGLRFLPGPVGGVLQAARNMVHSGHRMLADPGATRLGHRPNPYLTVFLSRQVGDLDLLSLDWIEKTLLREASHPSTGEYPTAVREDFQMVNLSQVEGIRARLGWD